MRRFDMAINSGLVFDRTAAPGRSSCALRDTAGTMRDDTATNTLVAVNGPRHHRCHRRVVLAAMPVDRRIALDARFIGATMLATITSAPRETRRPRNRTEGGDRTSLLGGGSQVYIRWVDPLWLVP